MNGLLQSILQNSGLTRAYVAKAAKLVGKNQISIGEGSNVEDDAFLDATFGRIQIGRRCRIHRLTVIDARGGSIEIGDDTWVEPMNVLFGQGGLKIGKNVAIAPGCQIIPYGHAWPTTELQETRKGITIGDDVWIGSGSMVLDGVEIGSGSVIGAGSVVNRDIPANSKAVGAPCRVVS